MAGMSRGRDATVPAWMAPGAPPVATMHPDTAPPDVEDAARAILLGEQDAAMRAALAAHSGQKRGFDERDGPAQQPEDPAALKVLLQLLPAGPCGFRCDPHKNQPLCAIFVSRDAGTAAKDGSRGAARGRGGARGAAAGAWRWRLAAVPTSERRARLHSGAGWRRGRPAASGSSASTARSAASSSGAAARRASASPPLAERRAAVAAASPRKFSLAPW